VGRELADHRVDVEDREDRPLSSLRGIQPRAPQLFDLDRMVRDGKTFDYSIIAPEMIDRSWVPSYCRPVNR